MGRTRAHQGEIASAGASGPQRVTDRLGRLLLVMLEAVREDADMPVLGALRSWLNSWRGIV